MARQAQHPGRVGAHVSCVPRDCDLPIASVNALGDDRFGHVSRRASSSKATFPLSAPETGHPSLAVSAAFRNAAWSMPGTVPLVSRRIFVILEPPPTVSRVHEALVVTLVAGVPARLFRVSFTGELGFEINVPANHGREVWEAVYDSGRAFGITPYGTETMHVLRAEKGYIIVGQESDGTVIPDDLGLSSMIGKAKPDFVGKRSLMRPDMLKADRKQLVGLLTLDPKVVLEEGAQVIAEDPAHRASRGPPSPGRGGIPTPMLGHVSSSYMSATLGRSIALAMVLAGRERKGSRLFVATAERTVPVDVVDPVFYDPEGARLNG